MAKSKKIENTEEIAKREAQTVVKREINAVFHRGPLPSPESMEKYENLYPGATKYFLQN